MRIVGVGIRLMYAVSDGRTKWFLGNWVYGVSIPVDGRLDVFP
jgi:hypothetical protein